MNQVKFPLHTSRVHISLNVYLSLCMSPRVNVSPYESLCMYASSVSTSLRIAPVCAIPFLYSSPGVRPSVYGALCISPTYVSLYVCLSVCVSLCVSLCVYLSVCTPLRGYVPFVEVWCRYPHSFSMTTQISIWLPPAVQWNFSTLLAPAHLP